jgi:predicted enzyme related to lactoylglutathione lyase
MHIAYVNVFVGDLTRALDFYVAVLGLDLQYSSPEHGYACLASGGVRFGLAVPGPDQRDLVGRHTGIGFAVSDLASEHIRLSGLAVNFPMPPTEQPWGGFMALFADPDGNVFYLDQINDDRP